VAWNKGQSGNPLGRKSDKPFADALRVELAEAGENQKKLRKIARNLIDLAAKENDNGALPAILAIADRLDGKPAQESNVTIEKRDATDWSLSELVELFHERRAARGRDITPRGSSTELN
jgi:hypothetical protein